MSSPTQQIKALIPTLPKDDIPYAQRFFDTRDWESLKELTWSALRRMEKALEKDSMPEKYRNIDIDKVRDLAVLCSEHYSLIYPEDLEDEFPDTLDSDVFEEDY